MLLLLLFSYTGFSRYVCIFQPFLTDITPLLKQIKHSPDSSVPSSTSLVAHNSLFLCYSNHDLHLHFHAFTHLAPFFAYIQKFRRDLGFPQSSPNSPFEILPHVSTSTWGQSDKSSASTDISFIQLHLIAGAPKLILHSYNHHCSIKNPHTYIHWNINEISKYPKDILKSKTHIYHWSNVLWFHVDDMISRLLTKWKLLAYSNKRQHSFTKRQILRHSISPSEHRLTWWGDGSPCILP